MKNILLAIILYANLFAVDYGSQIQPILTSNCTSYCHTNGGAYTGGLDLTSYSNVMDGGNHGPVVIPGDSQNSNLILKLSESPPFGSQMPEGGPYLSPGLFF